MTWPVDKVEDHPEAARGRLVSQYQTAVRLNSLVQILASRAQGLEDALYGLLTLRWIDTAAGQQLDELGLILGEPRAGRPDPEYRVALAVRARLNAASGEYDPIPVLASTLSEDAGFVSVEEIFPAAIRVNMTGDLATADALRLRQAVGAGIGLDLVFLDRFGVDGINDEGAAAGAGGFAELNTSTGEITGGARIRELLFLN